MAKSFKELSNKAETLIEQGKEADQQVQNCQANVAASVSGVAAAQRQLAAASMTDSEGNPMGDVASATAQLRMAERQLESSKRALSDAQDAAEKVRQDKRAHIRVIENHNNIEEANLNSLRSLQSDLFGSNAAALIEGIAQRHNEAEDIKVELLQSMDMDATPDYVQIDGGSGDAGWQGVSFDRLDVSGELQSYHSGGGSETGLSSKAISAPTGGALGSLINALFKGKVGKEQLTVSNTPTNYKDKVYTDIKDLSDEVNNAASDYQANHDKYNPVLRSNCTNDQIEQFRNIVNGHQIHNDSVFFRRASLADLGPQFSNIPLEDLAGRCFQFDGIMSTGKEEKDANCSSPAPIVFEVKTPAGMPGLDLTQVDSFREAMFDSPYCYIESVRIEGYNTPHVVVRMMSAGDGLNRVRDFNSLENYMRNKYNVSLDCSVKNLNFDEVKSAIAGVETVINQYPDVGNFLDYAETSKSGIMSCSGNVLSFNPDYFSDGSILHELCKEQSDLHHWIPNSSTVSMGAHEAAHGVEWALIQNNPIYIDADSNTTMSNRVQAWNSCSEAKKIVRQAIDNVRLTDYGTNSTRYDLIKSISRYATSNYSETMAEAFADVCANGVYANPLSIEIKRLTQLTMNKYKGGI